MLLAEDLVRSTERAGKVRTLPPDDTVLGEHLDAKLASLKIDVAEMMREDEMLLSTQSMLGTSPRRKEQQHSVFHTPTADSSPGKRKKLSSRHKRSRRNLLKDGDRRGIGSISELFSPSATEVRFMASSRHCCSPAEPPRVLKKDEGGGSPRLRSGKVGLRRLKLALHKEQHMRFNAETKYRKIRRENERLQKRVSQLEAFERGYFIVKSEHEKLKLSYAESEKLRMEQKWIIASFEPSDDSTGTF